MPAPALSDPGEVLLRAYQTGANISHQRAALEQQAQITNLELMQRAEDARQKSLENQQQLQVERAYRNIQTSLTARRLDQAEAENKQKAQIAGKIVLAKERAKARANQLVAGGMERGAAEHQAILENWSELGMTANQARIMSNPQKSEQEPEPLKIEKRGGQTFMQRGGKWYHIPNQGDKPAGYLKEQIDTVRRSLELAQKKAATSTDANEVAEAKKSIEQLTPLLRGLYEQGANGQSAQTTATTETETPTTPSPQQIVQATKRGRTNLPDWREKVAGTGVIAPETSETATTASTQPATEATTEKRVRVKSPNGKTGTIPASRLDAALKAGYTKVQDADSDTQDSGE